MVEMVETAAILAQATDRSFVILDEVGRGSSTYDGLALAWSVVEAVHEVNRCRCLFATHYHELTRLAETLNALSLHHVRAREWQGDLVLLHEVAAGPAVRSEEHTSELQSLMRISYAVFCLKKKKTTQQKHTPHCNM